MADSSKGARPKKPTPDLQAVVILQIKCHAKRNHTSFLKPDSYFSSRPYASRFRVGLPRIFAKYAPAPSQSIAGRSILPDADLAVTANSYTEGT